MNEIEFTLLALCVSFVVTFICVHIDERVTHESRTSKEASKKSSN